MDIDDEDDESVSSARLQPGTLARFADGLTWGEMYKMTMGKRRTWWRAAVARAEQDGLLQWDKKTRRWSLSTVGRETVRSVS